MDLRQTAEAAMMKIIAEDLPRQHQPFPNDNILDWLEEILINPASPEAAKTASRYYKFFLRPRLAGSSTAYAFRKDLLFLLNFLIYAKPYAHDEEVNMVLYKRTVRDLFHFLWTSEFHPEDISEKFLYSRVQIAFIPESVERIQWDYNKIPARISSWEQ